MLFNFNSFFKTSSFSNFSDLLLRLFNLWGFLLLHFISFSVTLHFGLILFILLLIFLLLIFLSCCAADLFPVAYTSVLFSCLFPFRKLPLSSFSVFAAILFLWLIYSVLIIHLIFPELWSNMWVVLNFSFFLLSCIFEYLPCCCRYYIYEASFVFINFFFVLLLLRFLFLWIFNFSLVL